MINKNLFTPALNILYFARLISFIGDWLYMVALTLILANQSPISVGVLWIIRSVAPLLSSFIAGTIADRFGHKTTAIVTEIIRAGSVGLMIFFYHSSLIFILVFITAASAPLFSASLIPIITTVTEESIRHSVNSILGMLSSLAQFLGSFMGVLLLFKNPTFPFLAESLTFLISGLCIYFIKIPMGNDNGNSKRKFNFTLIKEDMIFSLKFLWGNAVLRGITLTMGIFLFGSTTVDAYEVLFVTHTLGLNQTSYAFLVSIGGITYVLSSILNTQLAKKFNSSTLFYFSLMLSIVGNIVFTLSINIYIVILSQLIIALGCTTFFASYGTLIQTLIPIEYQGRVTSFQNLFPALTAVISASLSSYFITDTNVRYVILTGAIVMIFALVSAYRPYKHTQIESTDNISNF